MAQSTGPSRRDVFHAAAAVTAVTASGHVASASVQSDRLIVSVTASTAAAAIWREIAATSPVPF